MNLDKTIDTLSNCESKSRRGKYFGDAVGYAFKKHTLKLLARIAKQTIEPEYPPQESGKQSFKCRSCEGSGFIEEWTGDSKKHHEDKVIKDCDVCKGDGSVTINVIDKRKKSKNKMLEFDDKY